MIIVRDGVSLGFLQPRHRNLKQSLSWTLNVKVLRTFREEILIAYTSSGYGPTDSRPSYVSLGTASRIVCLVALVNR